MSALANDKTDVEEQSDKATGVGSKVADKAKEMRANSKKFFKNVGSSLGKKFDLPEPESVMEYQTRDLASWSTYTYYVGTVLQNRLQLWMVLKLLAVSAGVTALCMFCHLNPRHVLSLQFDKLNKTLNFFVGIMLAFFMGSSVKRWVDTVGGCLTLFEAIRNLNMQFLALGVNPERVRQVTRYGLMSCEWLVVELHMRNLSPVDRAAAVEKMWADDSTSSELEPWEYDIIKTVFSKDCRVASQIWIWVASLLGRMAQDGDIPPMASPTYGRIMNLAQDAQEGIRQVRISMTVQMPFVYVHTLAMLVHLNCICAAVDFGARCAIHVSGILWFHGVKWANVVRVSQEAQGGSTTASVEKIVMSLVTVMVPAFMYMAFLQIGLTLAQPFDESFGPGLTAIPCRKLISQLRSDIAAADTMNSAVSAWDPPSFKQSTAPKKP